MEGGAVPHFLTNPNSVWIFGGLKLQKHHLRWCLKDEGWGFSMFNNWSISYHKRMFKNLSQFVSRAGRSIVLIITTASQYATPQILWTKSARAHLRQQVERTPSGVPHPIGEGVLFVDLSGHQQPGSREFFSFSGEICTRNCAFCLKPVHSSLWYLSREGMLRLVRSYADLCQLIEKN